MPIDPEKLPEKWTPLVRRLAGMADRECGNKGFAIMTVEVLVHPNGEPAFWTEPKITKLESRLGAFDFLTRVLTMLGQSKNAQE